MNGPNDDLTYDDIEYLKKKQRSRYGRKLNRRNVLKKADVLPIQDSSVVKKNLNDRVVNGNRLMPKDPNRPESLWDLELEKEQKEKYRYKRATITDEAARANQTNADVLPAISGTGVLLNPLNKTRSAIDYVFVMNIRESEAFPPLLLKQDIECVEDRLSGYRCKSFIPTFSLLFLSF